MNQTASNTLRSQQPLRVFIAYAERDSRLAEELKKHLRPLEYSNVIRIWDDKEIAPGTNWREEISKRVLASEIILLLLSSDFLVSDYRFYFDEILRLQYNRDNVRIIPIRLRPVSLKDTPFRNLHVLPRNGRPVTSSPDADRVFAEIAKDIRMACLGLLGQMADDLLPPLAGIVISPGSLPSSVPRGRSGEAVPVGTVYQLHDVFVRSGIPGVTFVERADFQRLKLYLREPNRGVVLEGPSGIGKTTALRKALYALHLELIDDPFIQTDSYTLKEQPTGTVFLFNARNAKHQQKLASLRQWHQGMVVIDDFHCLPEAISQDIVNYLKELADSIVSTKKLVLVGIPYTGQALVNMAFDVAMRIDVLKFGLVNDELVLRMIEAGEDALNILFDRKDEIVIESNGSLNIAQYLCYNICANEGIVKSQPYLRRVTCDVASEVDTVVSVLEGKFGTVIKSLAAMGKPTNRTCLHILEALAASEFGVLSLTQLKMVQPQLAHSIDLFISDIWMAKLYQEYPTSKRFLFYNALARTLIIDDPQFTFYLKKLSFTVLAQEVGKLAERVPQKVFVSYSHHDTEWLKKLQVYLSPVVNDGVIDLWDDQKIIIGERWRDEIQKAIESASVAIMLVGPYFLASEFIRDYELPRLLEKASTGGTTIVSLIVDYCAFNGSGLSEFQSVNSPNQPLIAMSPAEQSKTLNELATKVSAKLLSEGK